MAPRRDPAQEGPDYRCKACFKIVPRGTHHKMTSCECGKVQEPKCAT